jgi:competence protein ComEC
MHKTSTITILVALLFVCFVPVVSSQTGETVTVHFIDVGQGDSIFIDTSNMDVLIDGGSATATQTVLDYLTTLSITHIHLVIATHPHEDHIGGLVGILNSTLAIDTVLTNNQTHTSQTYHKFNTTAHQHTVNVAQRGQTIQLSQTANITILNPVQPLEFGDLNDNSVVTKLQAGNTTFLFMGDAEEPAETSILTYTTNLKADVLKVGHHGSNTATCQAFLDTVDPTYAVILAGEDNSYGHPHEETLQKLTTKGVETYCTINSSNIIAQTDGTTITFPSNPTPIPENLTTTTILIIATITTITIYKTQNKKRYT